MNNAAVSGGRKKKKTDDAIQSVWWVQNSEVLPSAGCQQLTTKLPFSAGVEVKGPVSCSGRNSIIPPSQMGYWRGNEIRPNKGAATNFPPKSKHDSLRVWEMGDAEMEPFSRWCESRLCDLKKFPQT